MSKTKSQKQDFHSDWLSQVDVEGPFLALPVLKDIWKNGVDRLGDANDRLLTFKQAFTRWHRALDKFTAEPRTPESKAAYAEVNHAWIYTVLDQIAEWDELRTDVDVSVQSPGEQVTVRATGGLKGRNDDLATLLLICEPSPGGLRQMGMDGWPANEIDRLAMLLRKAKVEVGIVTDGQWWALVSARDEKPTGSGMFNALTWAEEPLLRDAFFALINQRRFRASDAEQRLTRLFDRSELEAEAITEALGTQVRRSVELLVQAFSEARLNAAKNGDADPLTTKPDDIYQAAVTVMMRIVFLLFAEERDMLPTEQLYWDSYAIKDLLTGLQAQAAGGEEQLDDSYDAWHRLLAVSAALHGGVNYDGMRMPAYGGSLLDPERFSWLHAVGEHGLRLKVTDRVMMHVLKSVQTVRTGVERRRISFREIDVEQIGYIYEGLLGYSCEEVADGIVLGLVGKDGEEPEVPLAVLDSISDQHGGDPKKIAAALIEWTKENQPAATSKTPAALTKLIAKEPTADERAELVRLLTPLSGGDAGVLEALVGWGTLIRRDLRKIPQIFPIGGLVVVETPSRKNAGAHYTPRSLAEDVVLHTLQPLVYKPGPLQNSNDKEWKLKTAAEILSLKVADIAAGSGAFLVAAARYLATRVVEAWTREGSLSGADLGNAKEVETRALREVIARCLYGADINPMAVEMCKLSLWLVSMDKAKPLSFVDDKIFCGNALLGVTHLEQLRHLHIYPKSEGMLQTLFVDVDTKIELAARLRQQLSSPVVEHDPMRSSRAKQRILEHARRETTDLRLIADGIVAAGLPLGGRARRPLDAAYSALSWAVQEAFPIGGGTGDLSKLKSFIEAGLTPSVDTDYDRWKPIHWVIETPEVITENGGFDAVVGNPAFLHSKKISTAYGTDYRSFLQLTLANGVKGDADLAAYFLLRQAQISRQGAMIGIVVTKSITQSHTYRVGLAQVLRTARIVEKTLPFDWGRGDAAVSVIKLWICRTIGVEGNLSEPVVPKNGRIVRSYVGTYPNGDGFRVSASKAEEWISMRAVPAKFLRPYLRAADISTGSIGKPSEFLIDVDGLREEEAASKSGAAWQHLIEKQRPWRSRPSVKPRLREFWWCFEASADALYRDLGTLDRCIVLPRTSNLLMPRFTHANIKFDVGVVVFATDRFEVYGQLASSLHYHWVLSFAATTRDDPSYAPKRLSDTFPWTTDPFATAMTRTFASALERACEENGGLRPVMNAVNSASNLKKDIQNLRELFTHLDREVMQSFGWDDLQPKYGFYERNNLIRFSIDPRSQIEVVQRLLKENHRRAELDAMRVEMSTHYVRTAGRPGQE